MPDWRDPEMPVLLKNTRTGVMQVVPPDQVSMIAQYRLRMLAVPLWHQDPTYSPRRRR